MVYLKPKGFVLPRDIKGLGWEKQNEAMYQYIGARIKN